MTKIAITPEIERRFGPLDNFVELYDFDSFDELCSALAQYIEEGSVDE